MLIHVSRRGISADYIAVVLQSVRGDVVRGSAELSHTAQPRKAHSLVTTTIANTRSLNVA